MGRPALRVDGLGKRYRLGLTHAGTLSEVAARWTRRLRGRPAVEAPVDAAPGADPSDKKGDFWALRDVSFEVQPGEVVGVIGRNGAGKSTLLKVLSRVTAPTTGTVEINGRVGSLLEVGTGFHPELTGRENVYMNATLLGMSKREVRAKLDEIVDFAGVEKFLDTPVKRYSSGMKVRLGFAVAAHLEPEVLIVDEVLSVGDAEFQKKCLGKMKDVAGQGRTVLFVSHNMAAVRALCSRGLLLDGGGVAVEGPLPVVVKGYQQLQMPLAVGPIYRRPRGRRDQPTPYIEEVRVRGEHGPYGAALLSGESIVVTVLCKSGSGAAMAPPRVGIGIDSPIFGRIFTAHTEHSPSDPPDTPRDAFAVRCNVTGVRLLPGDYHLKVSLEPKHAPADVVDDVCQFSVEPSAEVFARGKWGAGVVACVQDWVWGTAEETESQPIKFSLAADLT